MIELQFTEEQFNRMGEMLNGLFGNADDLLRLVQQVNDHNTVLRRELQNARQRPKTLPEKIHRQTKFEFAIKLSPDQIKKISSAHAALIEEYRAGRLSGVFAQVFMPGDKDFETADDEIGLAGDLIPQEYAEEIGVLIRAYKQLQRLI